MSIARISVLILCVLSLIGSTVQNLAYLGGWAKSPATDTFIYLVLVWLAWEKKP